MKTQQPVSQSRLEPGLKIPRFGLGKVGKFIQLVALGAALITTGSLKAQQIYLQTFNTDDSANWVKNYSYTNTTQPDWTNNINTLIDFNFDYTSLGLPIAPHSTLFGSAGVHHGLKLSAVYTNAPSALNGALTAGLSVSPTNFSISSNFVMHADMWVNVNCGAYPTLASTNYATSPHNGSASTVLYGCGYGTAGNTATTPGVTDAIFVGATADNGSSAQMRIYGPGGTGSAQSSLQDLTFQSTGTTIPGFAGDPFVYNSLAATGSGTNYGTRSWTGSTTYPLNPATNAATGKSWTNYFPATAVPVAQQILYPQQTNNYSCPGLPTFAWHDVSVEKIGTVIVYKIDGNIIATGTYGACGTPSGSFLTFMASRTTLTAASVATTNYTNLNFAVFANIVVSNYANIVNVSAPQPSTSEATPGSPGVFNITRSSAGVPLTVNYTLTGTAANGSQYQLLATNVTFAAAATDTNINVVPIDDGIPNVTTTVILTLQPGAGYAGAGSAVVNILDNDPVTVDVSGTSQAYGRYTNSTGPGNNADFMQFTVTRRGKLSPGADLSVNLGYGGSAVGGTDFTPVTSVTVPDGVQTATLNITPLDNPATTANLPMTVSVTSGTGYAVGVSTATGTIVSAHYDAAPVLLSNPLTSDVDSNNWKVVYGCGDPADDATDFSADFGISLASAAGGISIPPPPGGNANALHFTVNKNGTPSSPGGVNAYYTNLFLSGDYAVRFSMNMIEGQTSADGPEGPIFGINHSGANSNWWAAGGFVTNYTWPSDGIWYYVTAQPGGTALQGDYAEYTGLGGTNGNTGWTRVATRAASSFSSVFKVNPGPFTCFDAGGGGSQTAGIPANASPALSYDASTWSDVEMKQQGGIVSMSINHTLIFTYTNTTVWTNGYLMLGYNDPLGDSVGNPEQGVYYANLQVVNLTMTTITINSITISGGNVVIKFTTSNGADTTTSFAVQGSGTVNTGYGDVAPAAGITSLGGNQFQATTPYTGGIKFYRIHHL